MITVATYNVLADSYAKPGYFPLTPPEVLDAAARRAALVRHVEALDASIVCLQEVERPALEALAARLGPLGYAVEHAPKGRDKPDGCATFWRTGEVTLASARRLLYADGTGHVALVLTFERDGRLFGVANTHARWDPPATPPEEQVGLGQMRELLAALAPGAWIVCGDLNAEPGSDLVRLLEQRGFRDPFPADAFTCNANGRCKKIDYLFHTADLVAVPDAVPRVELETPLPSPEQPSDHLALRARFDYVLRHG